jgi:glc operon protein GlcG
MMMNARLTISGLLALLLLLAGSADGAAQEITLASAQGAGDAAQAEAVRNGWNVSIVVTDMEGFPLYVRRMDGASARTFDFALGKARTVVRAGMSTAEYVAGVAAGTVTALADATPIAGGVPLRVGDRIVGAIAASGLPPEQDAVVAQAGAAAFQR